MARIVVVTPNPAIDVTYEVAKVTVGETHRVLGIAKRPGGKGINVARGLHALGHETVSVLPLGGDSGSWLRQAMAELGMATAVAEIAGETRTTVAVTDGSSHPTLFSEPGPLLSAAEWSSVTERLREHLVGAAMLVVSGSLPPGADAGVVAEWIGEAHRVGVPVLVDATGAALRAAAIAGADVVKPNLLELLESTGVATLEEGARALHSLGAELVVVSLGSDGLYAMREAGSSRVEAIPGVTGNPTGAGDAAAAGLVSGLVEGRPLEECLRRAAALGAAAVLRPVAGEVDLDAFHRFLEYHPTDGVES